MPLFKVSDDYLGLDDQIKSIVSRKEKEFIKTVQSAPSPNRVLKFIKPGHTLISGPHYCKIFTNVLGRDFYIFGDYHDGPKGTCKKDYIEIATMLKHAFKTNLTDGRKIDFFFERAFLQSDISTHFAEKFAHWDGEGEDATRTADSIEKIFHKCLTPSKRQCKNETPYGKSTRFHYIDIRQPILHNKIVRQSTLSFIADLAEEKVLTRLDNASSDVILTKLEAAFLQFIGRMTAKVLIIYTDAIFSGYIRSFGNNEERATEEQKHFLKALLGAPEWVYEEVENILKINNQVLVFAVMPIIERVIKQLELSTKTSHIIEWAKHAIKQVLSEADKNASNYGLVRSKFNKVADPTLIAAIEEMKGRADTKYINVFDVAVNAYPGMKLSKDIASEVADGIISYASDVFYKIDTISLFDVYTLSRIFKPSIERDSGEVWIYAGATHASNYCTFLEKFLSKSTKYRPSYIGVKVNKSDCMFPKECDISDNPTKCLRMIENR